MNTHILFFDIDGTILSERTHIISENTKKALEKARQNGNLIFINTGRTIAELDEQILALNVDGYVCGCGTYIKYHNDILLNYELPEKLQKSVYEDITRYQLDACLEGLEFIYLDEQSSNPVIIDLWKKMLQNKLPLKHFNSSPISFTKFTIWKNERSDFSSFQQKYKDKFTFIDRGNDFFELVPQHYSKATGIEFLLNYFNIPKQNSFAFGDSANDLSMLEYVPNSIAMGNATKDVKEKVSFITKDVDENGIEFALIHYGLI